MPTAEEIAAAAAAQATADALAAAATAKAAADKVIADKAAADKIAADKVISDKAAADKAEADRIALSKLSDTEAALLKENMANKGKLAAAAAEKLALEERLKAFEGIDPAKAKEMLAVSTKAAADKKAADEAALVAAGDFERLKTMMAGEHKTEMTAAQLAIKETNKALEASNKLVNDLTVGAAFNTSKFIGDELVFPARVAREMYGANFDIVNGEVVAFDKPKGTEGRTKLVDSSGTGLGFEAAIAKLVDMAPDKDKLLKSKLKAGANSTTTRDTTVPQHQSSATTTTELTGMAAMKFALDKGALKKTK